jgi:thioredoxin 2
LTQEAPIIKCPSCGRRNRVRAAGTGAPHCANCGKPLPWMVSADDQSFESVVVQSSLAVLIDFWAPWCAPCRIVSPMVERLAGDMPGRIKVVKVNTDESPALSQRFDIKGIPTLVVMRDGKETDRVTGAMREPALREWVQGKLPAAASG